VRSEEDTPWAGGKSAGKINEKEPVVHRNKEVRCGKKRLFWDEQTKVSLCTQRTERRRQ